MVCYRCLDNFCWDFQYLYTNLILLKSDFYLKFNSIKLLYIYKNPRFIGFIRYIFCLI